MKEKLKHNLLLKVLSLVIAFTMWLVVINIEDPVDTKDFYNIRVNLVNSSSITDQNKVYEILDNSNVVRRVTVEASRKLLESLNASDIVAEADFEHVTVNETVEIKFYSTRSNDEIRGISGSSSLLKLNIEDKKTKRLALAANTIGNPREGYIVGNVTLDQNRLEVSGPESVISRIYSAGLSVDISDSVNDISTYAEVVLYDENGSEIDQENLIMNTESVKVRVPILATKTIPVEFLVTGTPEEGYLWTEEILCEKESVMVAGYETVLQGLTSVVIPETVLDLTEATRDLKVAVDIEDYLPAGVSLVGNAGGRAEIVLPVEQEQERTLEIPVSRIHFQGMPAELVGEFPEDVISCQLTVYGLEAHLQNVDESHLYGLIQISELLQKLEQEEMKPGIYEAEVSVNLPEDVEQREPLIATVIISESETE